MFIDDRAKKFIESRKSTGIFYCNCPGQRPGIISIDRNAHLSSCKFHKNTVKTTDLRIPSRSDFDGYSLGAL